MGIPWTWVRITNDIRMKTYWNADGVVGTKGEHELQFDFREELAYSGKHTTIGSDHESGINAL